MPFLLKSFFLNKGWLCLEFLVSYMVQKPGRNLSWESILIPGTVSFLDDCVQSFLHFQDVTALYVTFI